MSYKISVIIPTYNAENYLLDAVNSVKNQTIGFENIELIIVDDNSNDNTKYILNELSENHENIKTFSLENNSGSAGQPRNIGLEHTTADYIMFLDSDDRYLPNMCEVMLDTITKYDGDIVSCRFNQESDDETIVPYYYLENLNPGKMSLKDGEIHDDAILISSINDNPELLSLSHHILIWNKIFKKEIIIKNEIKFLKGAYYEDANFVCSFLFKAKKIIFLTKFFGYSYRIRKGEDSSVCHDYSEPMVKKQMMGFLNAMDLLEKEENDFNSFKSEFIVDITKIYIYSKLEKEYENEFLNTMKPFYKQYKITSKLNSITLPYNIIINIIIKLFGLSSSIAKFASRFYSKIRN